MQKSSSLPGRAELKERLKSVLNELMMTFNRMSDDEFVTPIALDKWSPGQHIGHLLLSTAPINKSMQVPKSKLEEKFGKNERQEYGFRELLDRYNEVLSAGSVKAPPQFVLAQVSKGEKEMLTHDFNNEIETLISQIDLWSEEDLSMHRLPHPVLGLLTLREMIVFTELHTLHHLKAINSVFH